MRSRLVLAALVAAVLAPPLPARAQERAEPTVKGMAARERQKKCGAEWRALSTADKAAQGPTWPKYFSKCVKRLKEQKA
ncbi:conserved hypothetical protein [Methylobacterium sp. 4-46]|uniref:hypothetical protein n=1 Tax=unclassified Methylobacterium TaxID=2615210 RepID=UPI000165CBC6|nr:MULTISPECIES: hypothetical protein [Methylobacterium]ACA18701.1 conserved hypothetical protein [Methylobacterium sp. 4-46]WFT77933.1 hypothetical protein QA634_21855 [Methylobacterium nodulans]